MIARFVTVVIWMCLVPGTSQHGYLEYPAQRGSLWREGYQTPANYNDNALFCGGRQAFVAAAGKCGVCGDPYYGDREHEAGGKYAQGVIAASYPANTRVIKVSVRLTTHHKGFFEFRICPHDAPDTPVTQECLDRNVLAIKGGSSKSGHTRYFPQAGEDLYRLLVELPPGIKCKQCVLHWRYKTGNSWGVEKDGKACLGCGLQEEFRNCADISIGYDDIGPGSVLSSSTNVTKMEKKGAFEPSKNLKNINGSEKKNKQRKPFDVNDPDYQRYIKLMGNNKKKATPLGHSERKVEMKTNQIKGFKQQSTARISGRKIRPEKALTQRKQQVSNRKGKKSNQGQMKFKSIAMSPDSPLLKEAQEAHNKFLKIVGGNSRQQSIQQKPARKKIIHKKQRTPLRRKSLMRVMDSRTASEMKNKRFRQVIPRVKTRNTLQRRQMSRGSANNFQPLATTANGRISSANKRKAFDSSRLAQTIRGNNARGMILPNDALATQPISAALNRAFPKRMIESPFGSSFRSSLLSDEFLYPYLPRLRRHQRSENSLFGNTQTMMIRPQGTLLSAQDGLNQRFYLPNANIPDVFSQFTFL